MPLKKVSQPYKIILASQSPRRKQLLSATGYSFTIRTKDVDESFPADLAVNKVAAYIAQLKANAHKDSLAENEIILTADTVVAYDGNIYGKPKSREEAIEFLKIFSGHIHQVYTAFNLSSLDKDYSETVQSDVKFADISDEEAAYYVDNYDAMDKAGAYGIQDWIGDTKVEWIKGSYTNIVGLPVVQVQSALKSFLKE